ncbi:hypothetical protein COT62_00445 [Candidatus Roizmanbacteria bacterium CG09_land_8_20_14_0_10_41_9]|uniref:DAHP synthetase I/KDSA domain-containing protein n=1 Tax=Candidatus Roizmanbacteria bacterium CG09_land_8_20_14_0_10_41_9 TaxID=1974850 RepID=A0A2H0WTR4_9BACT|nr:MAG: hypothetical protein COT62_00445 [Candidatus Roizmanbacteria bacterium CG09_land_8_20_14_0_10_41_9]
MRGFLMEKIIIAGPCAAESRKQVLETAVSMKERNIPIVRASLWKPRTKPGFDGVGADGIPWLAEATKMGVTVATEVLLPNHVTEVLNGIKGDGDPSQVLFWLGSRNQSHLIQREVASRMKEEAPETVKLMIKNQPWNDMNHWLGIVDHVTDAGFPPERILLCHRGFYPNGGENPMGLRNIPDFEMAMRVRELTGLPMLVDLSHIAGSVDKVPLVANEARQYDMDGYMIEVHPNPSVAKSDAKQQLNINEFDRLLKQL